MTNPYEIYKYTRGSRVYGIETETSDWDSLSVFLVPYKQVNGFGIKRKFRLTKISFVNK